MTQRELAERTGLTVNYLSLLENGKRGIGLDQLSLVGEALRVPAAFLVALGNDASDHPDNDAQQLLLHIQSMIQAALPLCAHANPAE